MKQQRDLTPVLAQLRSIKSDYELELLTRAGRIHEQVLIHDVAPFLHEGISEAELAVRLYLKMLLLGSHGVARDQSTDRGRCHWAGLFWGKSALVRTAFDGPGGTGGTCVAVQSIGSAFRLLKRGSPCLS